MIESNQTKFCPACAEEIKADARKCKHCGEWLDDSQMLRTSAPVQLPQRSHGAVADVSEEAARGLHRADMSEIKSAPSYLAAGLIALVGGVVAGGVFNSVWIGVVAFLVLVAVLGAKAERERKF